MTHTFDYKELLPERYFQKAKLFRISHAGWYQKAGELKRWEVFELSCSNDDEWLFWSEQSLRFVSEGNTQYELAARLKEKKYEVIHKYPPILGGWVKISYAEFKSLPRLKLWMWKF